LTVQTEAKPAPPAELTASAAISAPEETFDSKEGWRIAREALLREVVRYGGQALLVLAILGTITAAGYWSLHEMGSLPALLQKIAQPFMPLPPPPLAPVARDDSLTAVRASEEKARVKVPVKKHHYHLRPAALTSQAARRPQDFAQTSDNPTGGQIIYQDGMITQYSWNK